MPSSGSAIAALDVLDHQTVEWERVRRTAFLVHQQFNYRYPGPIEDLHHELIIVPPDRHLDQRRIVYRLDVTPDTATVGARQDEFGNLVLAVDAARVEREIAFEAWIVAERRSDWSDLVETGAEEATRMLQATPRTAPNDAIHRAARECAAAENTYQQAQWINAWTYRSLRYAHDITDVRTSAAEALALGRGVCQDFAHIMLAVCRASGLPARYVSGHLLGEGGTHAWVEVLLPADAGRASRWHAFDPTHDREPGMSYLTVAVGRDYGDVPPTSGTFRASFRGELSAHKHVGLTSVEYH